MPDEPRDEAAPADEITEEMAQQVLAQAVQDGLAVVPDEIATEMGRHVIASVMGRRQIRYLEEQIAALQKERKVMATDMAVLQGRLQEAGVTKGAEVAPAASFPEEPRCAEANGQGEYASTTP